MTPVNNEFTKSRFIVYGLKVYCPVDPACPRHHAVRVRSPSLELKDHHRDLE